MLVEDPVCSDVDPLFEGNGGGVFPGRGKHLPRGVVHLDAQAKRLAGRCAEPTEAPELIRGRHARDHGVVGEVDREKLEGVEQRRLPCAVRTDERAHAVRSPPHLAQAPEVLDFEGEPQDGSLAAC